MGSRDGGAARNISGSQSNVVVAQPGYLARPTTKAPETQIYFTTHRSGAFSALRLRTVVRGERASRSIMNRTTALWSIRVVASLILAVLVLVLVSHKRGGPEVASRLGSNGPSNVAGRRRGGLDGLYH